MLGLWHIYNNTNIGNCNASGDFVGDTPPQTTAHGGSVCNTFPLDDPCSPVPGTNGVMFMNFMDASPDDCWYMFTNGQRDRARSYFSQNGPSGTRYPFLANYFGIKRFVSTPVVVQNNTITVYMQNPACLPTTYTFSGPVTEISHDNQKIVFSVQCPSSGSVTVTATAGNYTDDYSFSFINQICTSSYWYKIYERNAINPGNPPFGETGQIKGSVSDNVYFSLSSANILNNQNHNGYIPSPSPGNFLVNYNSSGYTSWGISGLVANNDVYILNNGTVRTKIISSPNQYLYYDGITGNQVPGPSIVSNDEKILAETNSGLFITYTNGQIFVKDPVNIITTSVNTVVLRSYFNKNTNQLFIQEAEEGIVKIFELSGINLNLINSLNLSSDLYHVDNQGNMFFLDLLDDDAPLYRYDQISNSLIPLVVQGISFDDGIRPLKAGNVFSVNYTSDKFLIVNKNTLKIEVVDFVVNTVKGVNATGFCFYHSLGASINYSGCSYLIDGDNIYISGWLGFANFGNTASIGSQVFTNLITNGFSNFVSKLSLQNHFSRVQSEGLQSHVTGQNEFNIHLSPNPTTNFLTINIKRNNLQKEANSFYKITMTDRNGVVVMEVKSTNSLINQNISQLQLGVYFVTVTNEAGEKVSARFIKR